MRVTLADVLADMEFADTEPVVLGELPPLSVAEDIRRSPRSEPIPDLTQSVKLWQCIGEGNTGKTTLARWMIEMLISKGKLETSMIAALAPGNRNLVDFAPGTMQPPSADPLATASWAAKMLQAMAKVRWGGVWDFGGGDSSLRMLIQAFPTLTEQDGLAVVPAYLLGPRPDDLAFLKTFERMGFQPKATALILNLGLVESPSMFDGIRRQPEYKAALDRGAVELWMPALPQHIALAIERARVTFGEARHGDGKRRAAISAIDQGAVGEWLLAMEHEFSAVESWLPWM